MNLLENLGIQTQSVTAAKIEITVKVTDKLKQPYGIVHGGINTVLAETAASLGANQWLADHHQDQIAIGINITTEHLIAVSDGTLKTVATPIKQGYHLQTWRADIYCDNQLTSTSIVTILNRPRPNH